MARNYSFGAEMEERPVSNAPPKPILKVIVLGDSGVGKSTVVKAHRQGRIDIHLTATVGVDTTHKDVVVAGEQCILQLRDVAGQERYRSVVASYYRGCDACILMFSLDDYASFRNLFRWQRDILEYVHNTKHSLFPFLVVGNKSDLVGATPKVRYEDINMYCSSQGLAYYETTCDDFNTIDPVFSDVLWKARRYQLEQESCDVIAAEKNRVLLASSKLDQRRFKKCCF